MEAINYIKEPGFKQDFVVSDKVLNKIVVVKFFTNLLDKQHIASVVFGNTQPNQTISNINDGLAL
jgi:alcohol dehydrogenase